MTSNESGKQPPSTHEFLTRLEKLIAKAFRTNDWESAARLLREGIQNASTAIPSFCLLSLVIINRLFLLGETEKETHAFLVQKLNLESKKAALATLMAVDSAKKAVEVIEDGKTVDAAVKELQRNHKADPRLSKPMIELAVDFLKSATQE